MLKKLLKVMVVSVVIVALYQFSIKIRDWQKKPFVVKNPVLLKVQNLKNELPKMIDKVTRLDMINVKKDNVTYIYTVTIIDAKTEIAVKDKLKNTIIPNLRDKMLKDKDKEIYFKNQYNLKYIYRDNDGNVLGSIKVLNSEF